MRQLADEGTSIARRTDSVTNQYALQSVCSDLASWIRRADRLWAELVDGGYCNIGGEIGGVVDTIELAHRLYCP